MIYPLNIMIFQFAYFNFPEGNSQSSRRSFQQLLSSSALFFEDPDARCSLRQVEKIVQVTCALVFSCWEVYDMVKKNIVS